MEIPNLQALEEALIELNKARAIGECMEPEIRFEIEWNECPSESKSPAS